jgi:anti-anti-sigma factor
MRFQTRTINDYQLFTIDENVGVRTDFSNLNDTIKTCLRQGKNRLAFQFTSESYLYTHTLVFLVNFYKQVDESGGKICLVKPNDSMREVLDLLGFTTVIEIVDSEADIGRETGSQN